MSIAHIHVHANHFRRASRDERHLLICTLYTTHRFCWIWTVCGFLPVCVTGSSRTTEKNIVVHMITVLNCRLHTASTSNRLHMKICLAAEQIRYRALNESRIFTLPNIFHVLLFVSLFTFIRIDRTRLFDASMCPGLCGQCNVIVKRSEELYECLKYEQSMSEYRGDMWTFEVFCWYSTKRAERKESRYLWNVLLCLPMWERGSICALGKQMVEFSFTELCDIYLRFSDDGKW